MKISENTEFKIDIKTVIGIIMLTTTLVGMYYTLQDDIDLAKRMPPTEVKRLEYDLKEEVTFYVDLWHGKCRDAYLVNDSKTAAFIFKGPYSNWKKVINKELDPIRGLIRGMFIVEGDSKIILDQVKAAQELVNTASKIPVDFEK